MLVGRCSLGILPPKEKLVSVYGSKSTKEVQGLEGWGVWTEEFCGEVDAVKHGLNSCD